jgi:acyl-CoA thioester hydrolase
VTDAGGAAGAAAAGAGAAAARALVGETTLRVRYAETDTMGVVYYGNYLTYFEVGRVEFLRQNGHPMAEVDRRIRMPVVEAAVRYVKPARLDDLLTVRSWIAERKRASFLFRYEIRNAETGHLVATGTTRHACWHPETNKMIAIPEWLEALLVPVPSAGGGGDDR